MTTKENNFTIRKGLREDIPAAFSLIEELALFENAPKEVTNSIDRMIEDGFGSNPLFEFFIAEIDSKIIGLSIFYYRYSTWKGKCLYLEDLIVREKYRRNRVGKALFQTTMDFAHKNNCVNMNWQVLDWNKSAINFYKKYDTHFDDEWINCSISL